jgi:3-hydroxyacyl-[acyl-carrier-protein] dehydratase
LLSKNERSAFEKTNANKQMLDINEIMKIIPQRPPFLMIDKVESFVPGESAVTYKNVCINEPHFQGHFPGQPIMPGVLIVEALAQTGAIAILSMPENKGKNALFAGIDKLRFKKPVLPGDVLKLEVKVIKTKGPIGVGEALATVDGKVAAKGELTFAIVDGSENN